MRAASKSRGVAKILVRPALWFCACNLLAAVLAAQCSNPTQVPNGTYTSGDHSAGDNNALSAGNFVLSGSATATFVAGNCIQLLPGFHATAGTAGTTFHAWVETAPADVSVSPSSGSGLSQPFTWTVSSPSGYGNLSDIFALFNTSVSGASACYIHYNRTSNLLFLADNSGANWLGGFVPGSSGSASNSYCSIYGSGSSATGSGTQLALTVSVTFQTSFSGAKNEYLIAYDNEGLNSTWQQMGTWTVPSPQQYYLTTAVSPSGEGTISPASGWYNSGSLVTITATPGSGYQFSGFTGSVNSGSNPLTVTMNGAMTETANFTQTVTYYQLTTTVSPSGGGTVSPACPSGCSYSSGSQVTITATPASGYQFSGFTGSVNSGSNPLTVTLNSATTETANFTPTVTSLQITPTPVSSGALATISIGLSGSAPSGGMSVALQSSNPAAFPVPANCVVAAGYSAGTCTTTAAAVSSVVGPVQVTAASSISASIYVTPASGYAPTRTGNNIWALPVDLYTSVNSSGFIADCPSTSTIRSCVQAYLSNWKAQGASNIRFFIGLAIPTNMPLQGTQEWVYNYQQTGYVSSGPTAGDGASSHPWTMSGNTVNISSSWAANLGAFFYDAAHAGVTGGLTVSPVLAMNPGGSDTHIADPNNTDARECANGSINLMFVPWLPYGQDWSGNPNDDCANMYHSYSQWAYPRLDANGNTQDEFFWGWAPFQNLVQTIVNQAALNGATIQEFEIQQELNLSEDGVRARLIYDNRHGTSDQRTAGPQPPGAFDVLGWARGAVGSLNVTFSTADQKTTSTSPFTCNSLYGDPGTLFLASQLAGAIGGPAYLGAQGMFGTTGSDYYDNNNLPCSGGSWYLMDSLPPGQGHTQPSILDLHAYPCILIIPPGQPARCQLVPGEVTEQQMVQNAQFYYNDVWTFARPLPQGGKYGFSQVTFGESSIVQFRNNQFGTNCDVGGLPASDTGAQWAVSGYVQSNLFGNFQSQTMFLPFNNLNQGCYVNPTVLWPYDSTHGPPQ